MQTQSLLTNLLSRTDVNSLYDSLVSLLRVNRDEHNEALRRTGVEGRMNTPATTTSSTSETTVFTYSIPAKTLGTTSGLRLLVHGDLVNNTAGSVNYTFRGKLGGTTFFNAAGTAFAAAQSASPRGWCFDATIINKNAYNSQTAWGRLEITPPNASQGLYAAGALLVSAPHASLAVDLSLAATLAFTVQMGTNSASAQFRILAALLEVLP